VASLSCFRAYSSRADVVGLAVFSGVAGGAQTAAAEGRVRRRALAMRQAAAAWTRLRAGGRNGAAPLHAAGAPHISTARFLGRNRGVRTSGAAPRAASGAGRRTVYIRGRRLPKATTAAGLAGRGEEADFTVYTLHLKQRKGSKRHLEINNSALQLEVSWTYGRRAVCMRALT